MWFLNCLSVKLTLDDSDILNWQPPTVNWGQLHKYLKFESCRTSGNASSQNYLQRWLVLHTFGRTWSITCTYVFVKKIIASAKKFKLYAAYTHKGVSAN